MKYRDLEYLLKLCGYAIGLVIITCYLVGFFEGIKGYIIDGDFLYSPSFSSSESRLIVMFLLVGLAWPYLNTIETIERFILAAGIAAIVIACIASNKPSVNFLYFPFYVYVPLASFFLLRQEGTPIYYLFSLSLFSSFMISFQGIESFYEEDSLKKVEYFSNLFFGRVGFCSILSYLVFIKFNINRLNKYLEVESV